MGPEKFGRQFIWSISLVLFSALWFWFDWPLMPGEWGGQAVNSEKLAGDNLALVKDLQGVVKIKKKGRMDWHWLRPGMPIFPETYLLTESGGLVTYQFTRGGELQQTENSLLFFNYRSFARSQDALDLKLLQGNMRVKMSEKNSPISLVLSTKQAELKITSKSEKMMFQVTADRDYLQLNWLAGSANLQYQDESVLLDPQHQYTTSDLVAGINARPLASEELEQIQGQSFFDSSGDEGEQVQFRARSSLKDFFNSLRMIFHGK